MKTIFIKYKSPQILGDRDTEKTLGTLIRQDQKIISTSYFRVKKLKYTDKTENEGLSEAS